MQTIKKGQYTFYTNAIEKLTFFIFFVLLARYSVVDDYGNITSVFALANILCFLLEFGYGAYLQREASNTDLKMSMELSVIVSIKIVLLPLYLSACIAYTIIINCADSLTVIMISTLTYVLNYNTTLNGILYGRSLYRESFTAHAAGKVAFILFAFLSFTYLRDYHYLVFIMLLGGILQLILIHYYLFKEEIIITFPAIQWRVLRNISRSSLPMGLGIFFVFVYDKVDILLIQNMLGPGSVAVYSVGYSFYKLPVILISILLVPLFTELSVRFQSEEVLNIEIIKSAGFYLVIYSLFIIAFFFLCAGIIVPMFFGHRYGSSIEIVRLLSFALPGLFLNNLTGVVLNSIRKEKYPFYTTIAGLIINISINICFIPVIGIYGAVLATIFSESIVFLLQLILLKNYINSIKAV